MGVIFDYWRDANDGGDCNGCMTYDELVERLDNDETLSGKESEEFERAVRIFPDDVRPRKRMLAVFAENKL